MFTYDQKEGVLFSADAFGKFGALDIDEDWDKEARRYYYGIVGKFGKPVLLALDKVSKLDIKAICPLHGPVLLTSLDYYISRYQKWANYEADQDGVLIAVCSPYGSTMKVCNKLKELMEADYKSVKVIDLLRCDMSEAVARAFKYKKLVLASITYNGDMFPLMKKFIDALCDRNYQNRSVGFIQNGSWAPNSARLIQDKLKDLKDINILPTVTVKSTIYSDTELKALAEALKD
jgi:flavorubredoxin